MNKDKIMQLVSYMKTTYDYYNAFMDSWDCIFLEYSSAIYLKLVLTAWERVYHELGIDTKNFSLHVIHDDGKDDDEFFYYVTESQNISVNYDEYSNYGIDVYTDAEDIYIEDTYAEDNKCLCENYLGMFYKEFPEEASAFAEILMDAKISASDIVFLKSFRIGKYIKARLNGYLNSEDEELLEAVDFLIASVYDPYYVSMDFSYLPYYAPKNDDVKTYVASKFKGMFDREGAFCSFFCANCVEESGETVNSFHMLPYTAAAAKALDAALNILEQTYGSEYDMYEKSILTA